MTNNNTYKRPVIVWGNSFYINISLEKFNEGTYEDLDLTKVTDLKVYLICATHNTEIPLDYEIIPGIDNVLRCFVDYRLLHTTSYGIVVEGYDEHDIHFRFSMLPKEGFLVVNNTSGMQVTDEVQVIDISGRVGWGIQTDGDLTNYYTKIEVNTLLDEKADESELANKQDELVSGQNIKTINNQSLLGSGNIVIEGTEQLQADWTQTDTSAKDYIKHKPTIPAAQVNSDWNATSGVAKILNKPDLSIYATEQELNNYYDKGETDGLLNNKVDVSTLNNDYYNKNTVDNLLDAKVDTSDLATVATSGSYNDLSNKPDLTQYATHSELNTKQDTLVSGTNIKTINNTSLLGSGNVDIQSGGFVPLVNGNKTGLVSSLSTAYDTNIGDKAIIEGDGDSDYQIEASGIRSHAEGFGTKARGRNSHAEGSNTTASGNYSHAEGYTTTASGEHSHTEGWTTTANNSNSHAEGSSTTASGTSSHAEGHNNSAQGNSSHAEGENTISFGHQSHSEGLNTRAIGNHSHAEGDGAQATADNAHAEGYNTRATAGMAHAEGDSTKATGTHSHAEGAGTYATGNNAHAEGAGNADPTGLPNNTTDTGNNGLEARGEHSHAEGWATKAFGPKSHAEGERSIATGQMAHAEGLETIASGVCSHSEGDNTRATGTHAHAEGWQTQATGENSHAEGNATQARSLGSHAEGDHTTAGRQNCNNCHAEGYSTTAIGDNSHAEGINTLADGDYSHAEGNTTRTDGEDAHAEGSSTVAVGDHSHTEGYGTRANNESEHASGYCNVSTASSNGRFDSTNSTATLFSVGNGADPNHRHNAFEIKMNGDIYLNDGTKLQDKLDDSDEVTANALYELNSRLSETELNVNLIPDEIDAKIAPVNEKIDDISNDITNLTNDIDNTNLANSLILTELHNEIDDKQDELVSGTNIKTVNGNSLLGSGDITVGGGVQSDWNETNTTSLAYIQNKPTISEPGFIKVGNGLVNYNSTGYDTNLGNRALILGEGTGVLYAIKATGYNSFAHGERTQATGGNSHAEGFGSKASGNASHAEGSSTTAGASSSHAEGGNTTANNEYEHASGRYNIYNSSIGYYSGSNSLNLFDIGNGNGNNARHNAFEVRQNGDIYYSDTEKIDGSTVHFYDAPMRKLQDAMVTSTTNGLKVETVSSAPSGTVPVTLAFDSTTNTLYIVQ